MCMDQGQKTRPVETFVSLLLAVNLALPTHLPAFGAKQGVYS